MCQVSRGILLLCIVNLKGQVGYYTEQKLNIYRLQQAAGIFTNENI